MLCSRKTKTANILCVILVILSGILRLAVGAKNVYSYNSLVCVCLCAAAVIWISQVERRLLQKDVVKNLTAMVLLIIFYLVIRNIKYKFILKGNPIARYLWYCYYIPMIFVPLMMFFAVLHVGLSEEERISKKWKLLYIPSVILLLLVLTNDIHQKAFYFVKGIENINDVIRGPVYFAVMTWIALLFIAIVAIVFYRCEISYGRRKIYLPFIPFIFGAAYTVCIVIDRNNIVYEMIRAPEMYCVLFIAVMECLIVSHLFPSNDGYGDLWRASEIDAGIMDNWGVVQYRSKGSAVIEESLIRQAINEDVLINNKNTLLRSHNVEGGISYWLRDISEINRLNNELEDLGDVMVEENAMIKAENDMAESWVRIDRQNRLYDNIAISVKPQLNKLLEVIDELPEDEEGFERTMKYACIIYSYIKRHSNIMLLTNQRKNIDSNELRMSVSESLEYTSMFGVKTYGSYRVEGLVSGVRLLVAYEIFESVLEAAVPGAKAMIVNGDISDGEISLTMEISSPREKFDEKTVLDKLLPLNGSITTEFEDNTQFVSVFIPSGGDGK